MRIVITLHRLISKAIKTTVIIIILIAIGVPVSVYAYNKYNFDKFYNEGKTHIENEKYDEAISAYTSALKYQKKSVNEVNEQIGLAENLKNSKAIYETGLKELNNKKYKEAIAVFETIKEEDKKRYALSQEKIAECRSLYINDNIDSAKSEAANKNYTEGISFLNLALEMDSQNEQALSLKTEYINQYINDNVILAREKASSNKYEEAIKYLDKVLEFAPDAEEPLKLKDNYNKAIAEAKEAEKAKSTATKNSNSKNKEQTSAIKQAHSISDMKNEFQKLGFVFQSDTAALYEKNGIAIGLLNRGDCWQLATKTWGYYEESIFEDCMAIVLGRDLAWNNLIYIDYALSMPDSTHASSNVKAFVNDDKLIVYVYIPK
ncbi:tetratricopeptide repeat protein [Oxobacter pfennigii]|uniref:Tetratricopeptide repeat protein n=1 Tax=Oxobacter pfennigii TaxID=36849 RepID=A0A0P8X4J2_9CLOT|nr:tetratricopeptide repeat protein [Oxobacter pfennigii]KPU45700.1 tetratricopeptide repeat protein [Oxobacter pfennigii]